MEQHADDGARHQPQQNRKPPGKEIYLQQHVTSQSSAEIWGSNTYFWQQYVPMLT
jgi:hypothetical protein